MNPDPEGVLDMQPRTLIGPPPRTQLWADRHHWINALVGTLDISFRLSDEEQYFVVKLVADLLDQLDIPYRDDPSSLPNAVALEVESGAFGMQLGEPRTVPRPVREVTDTDMSVSVEAWRTALMKMLITAYPDLTFEERIFAATTFDQILVALGVPRRVAHFFPQEVLGAYREHDLGLGS